MIHSIIQIFVMAILFFAIFRESKRDRLRDMQQIDDIRKFFDLQAEYIARQAKHLSSVIKAQVELTYAERHDELMQEIKAIGSILNEYKHALDLTRRCVSDNNVMLAQIRDHGLTMHDELARHIVTLSGSIGKLEKRYDSQLSTLNSQLTSIETPVKLWGEAQVKNEIKKGEANRTLRHKLQEKREVLSKILREKNSSDQKVHLLSAELDQAKSAARDIVAESMKEISLIRSWMEERGVPIAPLEKLLTKEFKGNIPSQVYTRTKNEQALQETLSN